MDQREVLANNYNAELKLKGFKVYKTDSRDKAGHNYSRKDFYKISLTTGKFNFHYSDRSFATENTFLFFGNPHIPYSCEVISEVHSGYTCLFAEDFLRIGDRSESILHSPLFKFGGTPILKVNKFQKETLKGIFDRMISDQDSAYPFKGELMRNYIQLIIHEAFKIQPPEILINNSNAAQRVTTVFLELLERQFPVESKDRPLSLRTAQDFAKHLSLHVNYLNRSVKVVTGKPTTSHIAERIITEARALLHQTDWNIADIAYALGFEYPTYFNNFFKKMTGTNPNSLRAQEV